MVRSWTGVIAARSMACILGLHFAPSFLLPSPQAANRSLEERVNEYLKPYIDVGGFSGAILMARDGRILLDRGYGMANYETVDGA